MKLPSSSTSTKNFALNWQNSSKSKKPDLSSSTSSMISLNAKRWISDRFRNPNKQAYYIHSETCKSGLYQKCPFIKKSTILIQLLWNFVKIRYTCVSHFSKVWLWLGKNCGFFNKRTFLVESGFACFRVYIPPQVMT